jgi:hypothetical protein
MLGCGFQFGGLVGDREGVVKARVLVAVLLLVPLFARATCEEGAALLAATPLCHGHAVNPEPSDLPAPEATDCCPACDAFVSAHLSDPLPDPTSLSVRGSVLLPAPAERGSFALTRPPDTPNRPLSRENPPLLI